MLGSPNYGYKVWMHPPRLSNESERLARLRELLVLDSVPEPVFDRLAQLASQICGMPIALLSLVDGERQWFKARVGLPGFSETPRDVAFCAHTIVHDTVFEVPDAQLDPRFADNPLVSGPPHFRFCAGAPLVMPGGERVGTLCVLDREPRRLDAAQAQMLQSLAALASQALVMRQDLADSEHFMRQITDGLPVRIAYVDKDRRIRFVNQAQCHRFGLPREQILGRTRGELTQGADDDALDPRVHAVLAGQPQRFEYEGLFNGERRRIETELIPDFSESGEVLGFFATGIDITERTAAERELQRQAGTLRSVADAIPAIVAVVGADHRYRFVNSAFERWCGKPRADVVGRTIAEVLGSTDFERVRPWVEKVLSGQSVGFERDYPGRSRAGHLALNYTPLWLDNGEVDGFVGVAQDITPHKQEEMRLLLLTRQDPLTGLLNRAGFQEHLERRLQDGSASNLALLCIDLDHFKPVNDRHGHPVGDQVLQLFAQRLLALVRPTDAVARLGGDEFAIVLAGLREDANARAVADKVITAAHAPFDLGALRINIGASVGVAYRGDPTLGWRDLVARADAMLYRAKESGRGQQAGTPPV